MYVFIGSNFMLYCMKRDLIENFWEKYVMFVSEGMLIIFNFFKQSLLDYVNIKERVWYIFIIVFLNKVENEGK